MFPCPKTNLPTFCLLSFNSTCNLDYAKFGHFRFTPLLADSRDTNMLDGWNECGANESRKVSHFRRDSNRRLEASTREKGSSFAWISANPNFAELSLTQEGQFRWEMRNGTLRGSSLLGAGKRVKDSFLSMKSNIMIKVWEKQEVKLWSSVAERNPNFNWQVHTGICAERWT